MRRNIEIKAVLRDRETAERAAQERCHNGPTALVQEDTFFNSERGRLKLREFPNAPAELIYYDRPNQDGPKQCDFVIHRTESTGELKECLTRANGVRGVVRKTRTLYLVGQTRVHFDCVEGLGDYMELEVVMEPDQTTADGEVIARELMKALGINDADLVDRAYIDLLVNGDGDAGKNA